MTTDPQSAPWFGKAATHHVLACGLLIFLLGVFRLPLTSLSSLAFHDDRSSHILVVPLISALLIFLGRKQVFSEAVYNPVIGAPLLAAVLAGWYLLRPALSGVPDRDRLSIAAFIVVLMFFAVFILCYGTASFRAALFPLLFLLLIVPIPTALVGRAVYALQKGSVEASFILFRLLGVSVAREGFNLSLPGVDIEVAEQCSSIRSSLSLVISSLLAGHLFLSSFWRKTSLCMLAVPIAIFKNAVRIVTISLLGIYWNAGFFDGALHRHGGLLLSLIGLALLGVSLFLLKQPYFKTRLVTNERTC